MSLIVPTILASSPHSYRTQIERVAPFAGRVQIDLSDGIFAAGPSINPVQVWWPDGLAADIHLMFQKPLEHLETLVSLAPHMVIIHAEAKGDLVGMIKHLQQLGIRSGVALLRDTPVASASALIAVADHLLIFSGDLGKFGGTADLSLLTKIDEAREINSSIEFGWDGGATLENVRALAVGGIDIINVGGAIQRSDNPRDAYARLVAEIA